MSFTLLHNSRTASRLFFAWLRGLARLCTYVSSLLSVVSGALSFTVCNGARKNQVSWYNNLCVSGNTL